MSSIFDHLFLGEINRIEKKMLLKYHMNLNLIYNFDDRFAFFGSFPCKGNKVLFDRLYEEFKKSEKLTEEESYDKDNIKVFKMYDAFFEHTITYYLILNK